MPLLYFLTDYGEAVEESQERDRAQRAEIEKMRRKGRR